MWPLVVETVGKFLAGPVGSWLRVFAAVVLAQWLQDLEAFSGTGWVAYLVGGVIAVGPIVLAWLNPQDFRFGLGKTPPEG